MYACVIYYYICKIIVIDYHYYITTIIECYKYITNTRMLTSSIIPFVGRNKPNGKTTSQNYKFRDDFNIC